jgi:glutathione synthase/RimK-type ligase-like ATP-grasp enzyme
MILVVSADEDRHAHAVTRELDREETDVRLLDLSEFPRDLRLTIDYDDGGLPDARLGHADASEELALSECHVVWWRRPQQFELSGLFDRREDYTFAYNEAQSAFDGLWSLLDAEWVNHPLRDEQAGRKPYQLRLASEVGFEVPDTCITNDPERAREFVDEHGANRTVYKAFSATEEAWRETRLLEPDEVELIESVRFAPVIFQEYVPARADLRVTVVGDETFTAAIHAEDTSYPVDFRMAMDEARFERFELPESVRDRVAAFVARLGLSYAAIDLRHTPDGEFVFLEVNPAGQWLFAERRADLPITEAFADLLLAKDEPTDSVARPVQF